MAADADDDGDDDAAGADTDNSSSSATSDELDALFDNLEDALCDHLGEEHDDEDQHDGTQLGDNGAAAAGGGGSVGARAGGGDGGGGVEQWLYVEPWGRLHELGFGPYRALLSEYDLLSAAKLRALGVDGLARQLRELQLPESDIDRFSAVVFGKKIASATGTYDQGTHSPQPHTSSMISACAPQASWRE